MKVIKELWETFKKPLLAASTLFLAYLIVGKVIPMAQNASAGKSPIVAIRASCEKAYSVGKKYNLKDFKVIAIHENQMETPLKTEGVKLSKKSPDPIGPETMVTLTTKDGMSCEVKVQTNREKVVTFECGKPNVEDVRAVLYSNGELCFEGEGDILTFKDGAFPWKDYEGSDSTPVSAVSFEEGVTPLSLDGFFSDMETLSYIHNIPSSVESMVSTYSGCVELTDAPDLSNCTNLLDVSYAYQYCSALTNAGMIPASVRNATGTFSDCTKIQKAADVSLAESLILADKMYFQCTSLNDVTLPKNVQSLDGTLEGCINLKKMPAIPETVLAMPNCFSGDLSLAEITAIPASVQDVNNCFYGCRKMRGVLTVNGNPDSYSGFLGDAVVATRLDLQGTSEILDILAATSNKNRNITVNGKEPVWDPLRQGGS